MKRLALLLLPLLLISCSLFEKEQHYSSENFTAAVQTDDGGFLLAGTQAQYTYKEHSGPMNDSAPPYVGHDLYLVRVDAAGNVRWARTFGDLSGSGRLAVSARGDGSLLIGGIGSSPYPGGSVFVLKLDGGGSELWRREYTDSLGMQAALCTTSGGGFAFAGFQGDSLPLRFLRVDSAGFAAVRADIPVRHTRYYVFNGNIVETTDGDFVIRLEDYAGNTEEYLRVTAAGDTLWRQTSNPLRPSPVNGMAAAPNGGFAVAWTAWNNGAGSNVGVTCFGPDGHSTWNNSLASDEHRSASAITPCANGGFAIDAGTYFYPDRLTSELVLVLVDAAGPMRLEKSYSVAGRDRAEALCQTSDGGFVLAGNSEIHHNSDYGLDAIAVRTDPSGNVLWQRTYGQ